MRACSSGDLHHSCCQLYYATLDYHSPLRSMSDMLSDTDAVFRFVSVSYVMIAHVLLSIGKAYACKAIQHLLDTEAGTRFKQQHM